MTSICEVPHLLEVVELRDGDGDGRTVEGRVVPYDAPAPLFGDRVFEVFKRGAFTKTLRERGKGVPLYLTHHARSLIGRAVEWRDQDDGLHASFRVSETDQGEEALTLIRDGALHSFSIGFIPVPGKTKIIDEDNRKVIYERSEVKLDHVALVPNPAYRQARVLALRSEELAAEGIDPDELRSLLDAWRSGRLGQRPDTEPAGGRTSDIGARRSLAELRADLDRVRATA